MKLRTIIESTSLPRVQLSDYGSQLLANGDISILYWGKNLMLIRLRSSEARRYFATNRDRHDVTDIGGSRPTHVILYKTEWDSPFSKDENSVFSYANIKKYPELRIVKKMLRLD